MYTKDEFRKAASEILAMSPYPAVKFKIAHDFLGYEKDAGNAEFDKWYADFLHSDIVNELVSEQRGDGSWGELMKSDYTSKRKVPNTCGGIGRALYMGMNEKYDGRGIIESALGYLCDAYTGKIKLPIYEKNERAAHIQSYTIASMIESLSPYNPICDGIWDNWSYVAWRAFSSGEYRHELDFKAQNELFGIKGDRLIPLPIGFLLARKERLPEFVEPAMLDHYGRGAYYHGYFWPEPLSKIPESFKWNKTHRLIPVIEHINGFSKTKYYLCDLMEWFVQSRGDDGFWDWGAQMPDPFGYRRYLTLTKNYALNRKIHCSVEVLSVLHDYITNNS